MKFILLILIILSFQYINVESRLSAQVKIDFDKIYNVVKNELNVSKQLYDQEMNRQYTILKRNLQKIIKNGKGHVDRSDIPPIPSKNPTRSIHHSFIELSSTKKSKHKTMGIFSDITTFIGKLFDKIKSSIQDISANLKTELKLREGKIENSTAARFTQGVKNIKDGSPGVKSANQTHRFSTVTDGTFNLEILAKSFIKPVDSTHCWVICPDVWGYVIDPTCSAAAIAFCASMGPMGVTSNDESYGSGGNFRLFSKAKFRLTCQNNKPVNIEFVSNEGAVGKEGPLQGQPESGLFFKWVTKFDGTSAHIGYGMAGRPHGGAEPGFQLIRFRSCRYIWHFPYVKIDTCNTNDWSGSYALGASSFPTHKLWINGDLYKTIEQGSIENLWIEDYYGNGLVNGAWPYGEHI